MKRNNEPKMRSEGLSCRGLVVPFLSLLSCPRVGARLKLVLMACAISSLDSNASSRFMRGSVARTTSYTYARIWGGVLWC